MIQPIGDANAGAVDPAASGTSRNAATIDQEQFLMLFISQLQHQDPLNPLDSNGMTEQLAQFSSLEQLYSINANLESLTETLRSENGLDPLSFLGTDVSAQSGTVAVENGEGTALTLDLPAEMTSVRVSIIGPDGAWI